MHVVILNVNLVMQVGVHYDGVFYEFVPWNGVVSWEIAPWGNWQISADNQRHKVILSMFFI